MKTTELSPSPASARAAERANKKLEQTKAALKAALKAQCCWPGDVPSAD